MTLNDYFDYKIDVKERPNRPLPSGKIPKLHALYIGFCFLILANLISAFVGLESVIVTTIMTILIITYNVKSKKISKLGVVNLAVIRFLNVVLGGTAIGFNQELFVIAIPIGILVSAISIFAKIESANYFKNIEIFNVILVIGAIIAVIIITFDGNLIHYVFIILFSASIFIPFFGYRKKTPEHIQKKVTFQLLSITLLDAAIISAFSEELFAIIAAALYIPAYFTLYKIYLT